MDKKIRQVETCRIFWQGRKDSILARTARSVFRGSDSPPDCHSLPLPFDSFRPTTHKKRRDDLSHLVFFWQGRKDSNPRPMVLETSTLPTELHPFKQGYYIKLVGVCQGVLKKIVFFLAFCAVWGVLSIYHAEGFVKFCARQGGTLDALGKGACRVGVLYVF